MRNFSPILITLILITQLFTGWLCQAEPNPLPPYATDVHSLRTTILPTASPTQIKIKIQSDSFPQRETRATITRIRFETEEGTQELSQSNVEVVPENSYTATHSPFPFKAPSKKYCSPEDDHRFVQVNNDQIIADFKKSLNKDTTKKQVTPPSTQLSIELIETFKGNRALSAQSPVPPSSVGDLKSLGKAISQAAHDSRSLELIDAAIEKRKAIERAAKQDNETLSNVYITTDLKQLQARLSRSEKKIQKNIDLIQKVTSGLSPGEKSRFTLTFQNARDKVKAGQSILNHLIQNEDLSSLQLFGEDSPFTPVHPLAPVQALEAAFGKKSPLESPVSQDNLTNRMIMLSGLTLPVREKLIEKIKLIEILPLLSSHRKGKKKEKHLALLHNGYLFGGGETAIDCSSFVSSILPSDVRKGRLTTLDFKSIWEFLMSQSKNTSDEKTQLPRPPKWDPSRENMLIQMASSFDPVRIYQGQPLTVGDLLIFRLPWMSSGHIFIIRDYNPKTFTATVIEAAQSAGTIREREFILTPDPVASQKRYYRPGLYGLRLKPRNNHACRYNDNV